MTHTCLECTHCDNGGLIPLCTHPDNGEDLVRGGVYSVTCRVARSNLSGLCGPSGVLFSPVPESPPDSKPTTLPLWRRLVAAIRRWF